MKIELRTPFHHSRILDDEGNDISALLQCYRIEIAPMDLNTNPACRVTLHCHASVDAEALKGYVDVVREPDVSLTQEGLEADGGGTYGTVEADHLGSGQTVLGRNYLVQFEQGDLYVVPEEIYNTRQVEPHYPSGVWESIGYYTSREGAERVALQLRAQRWNDQTPIEVLRPYAILVQNGTVYVKDGEFFTDQGGLYEPWGMNWTFIKAVSVEDARTRARKTYLGD